MSEPSRPEPSFADRARDAVDWLTKRTRSEWIMFAIGFVLGVVVA